MRLRRKLFIALGTVLAAAIVIPWIVHWRLRAINEAYIRELVARGEPMTLPQVTPLAVPAAENSADVFLQATALLEADTSLLHTNSLCVMLPVGVGKAAAAAKQAEAVGYDSTNSWAEVTTALAKNKTALDLLQEIIGHPAFDFHINYRAGVGGDFDFNTLHLIDLRTAEKYLSAAVVSALHNGDTAAAVDHHRALLALINAAQNERLVISEWVRMAMIYDAQRTCWEILESPAVTADQLAELQRDWERINYRQSSIDALEMERATGMITLAQWRRSTASFNQYLDLGEKARQSLGEADEPESLAARTQLAAEIFLWRFWWSYPDELRSLKGYEALLEASRFSATNGCYLTALTNQAAALDVLQITKLPNVPETLFSSDIDFHSLMSQSIVTLAGTLKKAMTAETARQMTITAIALQRFKLAHGHYPEHLSGLVPEFLTAIPPDPVDGRPLRYRRQSAGNFLLYSVGENGVDDGGDPSPAGHGTPKTFFWQDSQALDWVWPQATTADGVQFIYTPATGAK